MNLLTEIMNKLQSNYYTNMTIAMKNGAYQIVIPLKGTRDDLYINIRGNHIQLLLEDTLLVQQEIVTLEGFTHFNKFITENYIERVERIAEIKMIEIKRHGGTVKGVTDFELGLIQYLIIKCPKAYEYKITIHSTGFIIEITTKEGKYIIHELDNKQYISQGCSYNMNDYQSMNEIWSDLQTRGLTP